MDTVGATLIGTGVVLSETRGFCVALLGVTCVVAGVT